MPQASFSVEALANALDAYLLLADSSYDSLPTQTRQAIDSYFAQLEDIQSNQQFTPTLSLPEKLGLPATAAYIAVDSQGLLIPGTPMSLAQYLRELLAQLIEQHQDLALQSTAFQAALSNLQNSPRSSPAETAAQINDALSLLNLDRRDAQDPWSKIRIHWQYAFTHPDLMEQTIIGYNLDALEAAKLRLAETRSRFSQADLALHLSSQDRAAKAEALKATAKEALSSKEWIVISKQSTKVPSSLP